jgi:hypothetical protein
VVSMVENGVTCHEPHLLYFSQFSKVLFFNQVFEEIMVHGDLTLCSLVDCY